MRPDIFWSFLASFCNAMRVYAKVEASVDRMVTETINAECVQDSENGGPATAQAA